MTSPSYTSPKAPWPRALQENKLEGAEEGQVRPEPVLMG